MHSRIAPRALAALALSLIAIACKSEEQKCSSGDPAACGPLCEKDPLRWCHSAGSFDHANAVKYLAKGCDAGDPEACAFLAARYAQGKDAPLDPEKAKEYADRACKLNDPFWCDQARKSSAPAGAHVVPQATGSAASKPSSGSEPMVTSTADVDVSLEGHDEKLGYGIALIGPEGTLSVLIADKPFDSCSRGWSVIDGEPMVVSFDLPPGPGGSYFAGHAVGPQSVSFSLPGARAKDPFALGAQTTKVTLEAFKLEKGARVRGTIEFHARSSPVQTRMASGDTSRYEYDGKGGFDLILCKVPDKLPAPAPDKVDAGAVSGTLAGAPFTAKSALAFVFPEDRAPKDGVFALHNVELYADAGVTCATRTRETHSVNIGEIGGANTAAPILNASQPVSFSQDVASTSASGRRTVSEAGLGTGWATLDAMDLTQGGHVKGQMYVLSEGKLPKNQAKLGGHFDATVCVLKPLF